MIRVLEVFREPLAFGGQESFIMNMYRNMDHSEITMDFLTPFTCDNQEMKAEIESYGGHVFSYGHPFAGNRENNRFFRESVEDFLKKHHYETVHFHSGSTYALMEGPKIAAKAGIPNRIVHSHCGGDPDLKYYVIKTISDPVFRRYTTKYCACSDLAASWKFPASVIRRKNYQLLKNAIDLDRFSWDPQERDRIRKENGVGREIVLGHIGRFSRQKNHEYLIDVFEAFHLRHPDSKLWLAGIGEKMDEIRKMVRERNLEDSVSFLGLREDIPALMNGMDALVLPSLFEGLPVVGVEAQAESLPVITSDQVAKELPIPALSTYVPLGEENVSKWVFAIEKALKFARYDRRNEMRKAGYDVREAAKSMQKMYEALETETEQK